MKLLQETNDKESSFPKHKAKTTAPEKQSVVSQIQSIVLYQFENIKTEFKEIKDRENAYRGLYWFTLNPELHTVFSETIEEIY